VFFEWKYNECSKCCQISLSIGVIDEVDQRVFIDKD
jgi:hypothetical protein